MGTMSSTNENFIYHDRVGMVRTHFALSQTEMSKRVGISLRAYQNYERGEREIPVGLVRALFEEFKVDPVWLLTGLGSMIQPENQGKHLDQALLDQVVEAVDNFETGLNIKLTLEHKSRLIGLLYAKSQLISEVAGEQMTPTKIHNLLKLVA